MATSSNSWVTCHNPKVKAQLRLFCFPYAGGGASIFRSWQNDLPPTIQVCPVQLPGRENRLNEPSFIRFKPLVQALVQAILPYLDMPYAFFGHSLGALIAFELTRALIQENQSGPIHLFVSGRSGPQVQSLDPPIHNLPESDFIEKLRELGGTPSEVLQNAELMELLLPVLYADFATYETYDYIPRRKLLDCPISAFGGLQDNLMNRDSIAMWSHQTYKTFTLRMFPGDHFFIRSAQHLLASAIVHDLALSREGINRVQRL